MAQRMCQGLSKANRAEPNDPAYGDISVTRLAPLCEPSVIRFELDLGEVAVSPIEEHEVHGNLFRFTKNRAHLVFFRDG